LLAKICEHDFPGIFMDDTSTQKIVLPYLDPETNVQYDILFNIVWGASPCNSGPVPLALFATINKFAMPLEIRFYDWWTKARAWAYRTGRELHVPRMTVDSFPGYLSVCRHVPYSRRSGWVW